MCLLYSRVVRNVKWTLGSLALGSCAKGRAAAALFASSLSHPNTAGTENLWRSWSSSPCWLLPWNGTSTMNSLWCPSEKRPVGHITSVIFDIVTIQNEGGYCFSDTRWVYSKYAVLLNTADLWWQMTLVSHLRYSALDWLTADFLKSDIWCPLYWGFERHFCTVYVTMLLVIKWLF